MFNLIIFKHEQNYPKSYCCNGQMSDDRGQMFGLDKPDTLDTKGARRGIKGGKCRRHDRNYSPVIYCRVQIGNTEPKVPSARPIFYSRFTRQYYAPGKAIPLTFL